MMNKQATVASFCSLVVVVILLLMGGLIAQLLQVQKLCKDVDLLKDLVHSLSGGDDHYDGTVPMFIMDPNDELEEMVRVLW